MTERIGTNTFLQKTGISAPKMRELEALGVIAPEKSDTGWRQFSIADVQATLAWKAQRAANVEGAAE